MRELKGDWRDLFNGFMVALDLRKCFLALCGIFVTILLCGGLTFWVGNTIDPAAVTRPENLRLHEWWNVQNQAWDVIYDGAYVVGAAGKVTRKDPNLAAVVGYTGAFALLLIAIWSYFGGAIARIAAYEIAKDGERIETRKALQFAKKKFWSFFWSPLICLIGLAFFAICNYVGGLVGGVLDYLHVGAPLVALLLPLALLSGFIMTLIALGTVAGLPLFAPAVAAEGTDSFDAVSRGFSYVYSRPWHYLGYQIVSAVYGYVCIGFVIVFAVLMCHWGIKAGAAGFKLCGLMHCDAQGQGSFDRLANASWGLILSEEHQNSARYGWDPGAIVRGPHPYGRLQALANDIVDVDYMAAPVDGKPLHSIAGAILTFWLVITLGLALGYVVSYAVSQQTMIYYILRKKVDGIEMNEVFEETEEEAKPATVEAPKPADAAAPPAAKPEDKPAAPPPTEGEKK